MLEVNRKQMNQEIKELKERIIVHEKVIQGILEVLQEQFQMPLVKHN